MLYFVNLLGTLVDLKTNQSLTVVRLHVQSAESLGDMIIITCKASPAHPQKGDYSGLNLLKPSLRRGTGGDRDLRPGVGRRQEQLFYIYNYTMVKVRLFCWWCCVCCIVLLTSCILFLCFYEPAMTTTKLPLVG